MVSAKKFICRSGAGQINQIKLNYESAVSFVQYTVQFRLQNIDFHPDL